MKGKIPVTQTIILESDESQWMMLVRGLINNFKATALVEIEPGKKVRIKLVINQVVPPDHLNTKNSCCVSTNSELVKNFSLGLSRSSEFLSDLLDKTRWVFIGYINGDEKAPILIIYYKSINITIYTQKLKGEDHKEFFPGLN